MKHQILGLRPYTNPKNNKTELSDNTFFGRWEFPSLHEFLLNPDPVLASIPESERWNLYYTVALAGPGKREFRNQPCILFDIDKLDTSRLDDYIAPTCQALGIDPNQTGIIASGHGLHFIIELLETIPEAAFIEQNRLFYRACCEKINLVLRGCDLIGETDPHVWDARRIMRLPGTINRKPGLPDAQCRILQANLTPVDFNLERASGLPKVTAADHIHPQTFKTHIKPDTKAVQDGCEFLKHCKAEPAQISEGEWYAMLSIVGRLDDGLKLAHEYSKGHPGYSHAETETKLGQALARSGPRTCTNIDNLWGKCQGCAYNGKVQSPISIASKGHIKTEGNGFYNIKLDENGAPCKGTGSPNYDDLLKKFIEDHAYVTCKGVCYIWTGTHFKEFKKEQIEAYAEEKFNPKPLSKLCYEFYSKVMRQGEHQREPDWFNDTTTRKMNFLNGVLDLGTMGFVPASPALGFRHVLTYNYDPMATATRFERFMLEVMQNDLELVEILLEFAGYGISNDECWLQKCLIMTGEGRNGKSKFQEILGALIGGEQVTGISMGSLKSDLARGQLEGKLLNIAEETPSYALNESSHFKNVVTGGLLNARRLYYGLYNFHNRCKLIFACNEIPQSKDCSDALFRRLIIVPFHAKFEGETDDKELMPKLTAELPGILNLVLAAYHRLKARKDILHSKVVASQLETYKMETDSVASWLEDNVQLSPESKVRHKMTNLHIAYSRSCATALVDPVPLNSFSKRLLKHYGSKINHARVMEKGVRGSLISGITYTDGGL